MWYNVGMKTDHTPATVFTRLRADVYRRLRLDAARRGMSPGAFLNKLLMHRGAYRAALAAYDDKPPRK